jgi:AraC family transcriptional regulator
MIERDVLCLLRELRRRHGHDVSLEALARRAGWSPFHLHRAFRRVVRQTPKQYTQRVRLERAAAQLATSRESVALVAIAAGFASHEVFTRAFRRRYGCSPAEYRAVALAGATAAQRARHAELVDAIAPCVSLYRMSFESPRKDTMPTLTIVRKEIAAQPILFARRRCSRAELAQAIGECLGAAFAYAQASGCAVAGYPFVRYAALGAGLLTIEGGCPVAVPAPGSGDIEAGTLFGGPVVVALHAGPYDELHATYAAMERWMEANGHRAAAAPWESYLTDPGEHPNPADWRTEIYWPIGE